VADHYGPRWALGIGAASGFAAAIVGLYAMMRQARRERTDDDMQPTPDRPGL